ncbi:hypothetical protein QOT17_012537 [Balamuthia mandrillaris]
MKARRGPRRQERKAEGLPILQAERAGENECKGSIEAAPQNVYHPAEEEEGEGKKEDEDEDEAALFYFTEAAFEEATTSSLTQEGGGEEEDEDTFQFRDPVAVAEVAGPQELGAIEPGVTEEKVDDSSEGATNASTPTAKKETKRKKKKRNEGRALWSEVQKRFEPKVQTRPHYYLASSKKKNESEDEEEEKDTKGQQEELEEEQEQHDSAEEHEEEEQEQEDVDDEEEKEHESEEESEYVSIVDEDLSENYKLHRMLRCHLREGAAEENIHINACTFHPTRPEICATAAAECICILDCKNGTLLKRYTHPVINSQRHQRTKNLFSLAWTVLEDGTDILAAGGNAREILLIDLSQNLVYDILQHQIQEHGDEEDEDKEAVVRALAFCPGRKTLLASACGSEICLWGIGEESSGKNDLRSKARCLLRLRDANTRIHSLAFCPFKRKGEVCLLAGATGKAFLWPDLAPYLDKEQLSKKKGKATKEPRKNIIDVHFSEDARLDSVAWLTVTNAVIKSSMDEAVLVMDVRKKQASRSQALRLNYPHNRHKGSFCLVPKKRLWVGTPDASVLAYDLPFNDKQEATHRLCLDDECTSATFSQVAASWDETFIVGGTTTNVICIWKLHKAT